jgi:hypothetical protein
MKNGAIRLQESLERRILHGLSCEWEKALWYLSPHHSEKMRKPLFSLSEMNGKWGTWSGKKREITLSRSLVLDYSWNAVREVLKHEIAHQLAEEVLGARNEPPHGPVFREACYHLRADPTASGHFRILEGNGPRSAHSKEDKMMVRIKKLMSLAQSRNRHEAEAAMAKAHELVDRYNIDLVGLERERDFVSLFLGRPGLRHFREVHRLAVLLNDFYYVFSIWESAYVIEKGKMGRVLEISGTEKNVQIASYVYDFVNYFIDSQWQVYNRNRGLNRYRRTDFALGILKGFEAKLKAQSKEHVVKAGYGLIKIDDPQLERYKNYRYPCIRKNRGGPVREDPSVRKDGEKIGNNLIISKGIHRKGGKEGLLLE